MNTTHIKKAKSSFSTRSFISLLMAFCFVGLALSGVILYFAPPCSIANAINWTVLALPKTQWASLHQVLAIVILVLAVIHLFIYNWKTFLCYFRKRKSRRGKEETSLSNTSWLSRLKVSKEVVVSVSIAIVLYVGAFTLMAPFGWLQEGSDAIEEYYRKQAPERFGRGMSNSAHQEVIHSEFDEREIIRDVPEGRGEGRRYGSGAGRMPWDAGRNDGVHGEHQNQTNRE